MKQARLKFPQGKAAEVAKFFAENGIVTNLSYSTGDGFFDKHILCIICFPADAEDKIKANLHNYIQA